MVTTVKMWKPSSGSDPMRKTIKVDHKPPRGFYEAEQLIQAVKSHLSLMFPGWCVEGHLAFDYGTEK